MRKGKDAVGSAVVKTFSQMLAQADWSSDAVKPLIWLVEGFAHLVTFSLPKSDTAYNFYINPFDTKILLRWTKISCLDIGPIPGSMINDYFFIPYISC